MKQGLGLLVAAILVAMPTSAWAAQPGAIFSAQKAVPSGANSDGAANVDPIVAPGPCNTPSAHPHVFVGAQGLCSDSTAQTMLASATSFVEAGIRSAGWWPEWRYDGQHLKFGTTSSGGGKHTLFYYRETIPNAQMPPLGLKMVLGVGVVNGVNVNLGDEIIFKCGPGSTGDKPAPPASCSKNILVDSYRFPNCWDGFRLDSPDHISHMAYPVGNRCPASHPVNTVRIEQFRRVWVPGYSNGIDIEKLTLGGNHWSSAHADYMFAWQQGTVDDFMVRCITPNVACSKNINLANI